MKLSPLPIYLLGIVFAICVLLYAFMVKWTPDQTEAGYYRELATKYRAEAAKMPDAKKRVADAKAKIEEIGARWQEFVIAHTPQTGVANGGIDLSRDRWSLTVDAPKFHDNVQRALNTQLKRGGITVVSGPSVPMPPGSATNVVEDYFNFPAFNFPVAIFDLGQVTVQGSWSQIAAHMAAWRDMPNYMAVTDGLTIQGLSPTLTATYNLTLVAYIRGQRISPPVPEVAGPSGAGGGNQPTVGGGSGRGGGGGGGGPTPITSAN